MTTVIIDDEQACHDALTALLRFNHPDIKVVGRAYSVADGIALLNRTAPDLIFLDIEMPDGTGFDLLKHQGKGRPFSVVFITAHDKHAVRAFNFAALDFVLKPINTKKLGSAIERARERLQDQSPSHYQQELQNLFQTLQMGTLPDRLMIRKQDGIDFVPLHHIIRLESGNERVNIFLQSGERLDVSGRIGDYETRLVDHRFFLRVHRSFLINLRYLSKLEGNKVIMSDGTEIQVSYDKYMAPLKMRLEELFD